MNYLEKKKRAFMANITQTKAALIEGQPPLSLPQSVGKPLIDYEIHGNSSQTKKNLLTYPYINNIDGLELTTYTNNGITFTNVGDGTINVNGTATKDAKFLFRVQKDSISKNSLLYFSGCPAGGSGTTYNLSLQFFKNNEIVRTYRESGNGIAVNTQDNYDQILVQIYVASNLTVDNLIFKPQLERNILATEFETPAVNPTTPLDIISLGDKTKNLFNKETCHCNEIKAEPPTVIDINTYTAGVLWSDQLISLFKPNTTYTISCEIECVDVPSDDYTFNNGILGFLIQSKVSGYSSINALVTYQLVKGEIYHFSKTFTVPSNFSEGTYAMYIYRNSYKDSNGKIITASAIFKNVQIEEGSIATEYEPYGYKIPIITRGKNVFDITKCNNYDSTRNGIYMPESIDRYAIQGKISTLTNMIAGRTYVISAESSYSTGHFVYFRGSSRVIQWGTPFIPTQKDIDNDIIFYKHTESNPPDDNAKNVTITNVQIEEGLTATNYEPYQQSIETNIYLKEPLRKSKDFADYIDFTNSKIIRNIDEVKFTGMENWQMVTSGSLLGIIYLGRGNTILQTNYGYCSHFPFGTNTYATDNISWWYVNNVIRVKQKRENDENILYKDATEFKTFLQEQNAAGTPVTALIPRTTPLEESIVGLPKIPTLKGTTIISIPSELIVPTAKAKYYITS